MIIVDHSIVADDAVLTNLRRVVWQNEYQNPAGVVVNVVAPCITETISRKPILEKPGYKEWAISEKLASGRWNQPEDLVGAVLFLASPQLSAQVIGHVLMVDGGWTIH